MRLEGQIKKLRRQVKLLRKGKHTGTKRKEKTLQKITGDKSDNTNGRNKSKDIGKRRKIHNLPEQTIQIKWGVSK